MNLFKIFFVSIFAVSLYASSDIIASVNGENISVKDVGTLINKQSLTKQEMLQNKQGYTQLINKIIDEKLIEQNILQNNLIIDQDIKSELTMLSLQTIYKKYRNNLLSTTSVSDKEIADFYAANQAKMKSTAKYKTLYISLNSNSIAEKDLLNDIKNAADKKQAMIRANAREKTLTKSMFPDDNSFSKLSTLKKGDVSNELVKIGNQYYIFYILDKQEAKNLTLEQASSSLKNVILKNKIEKQLQEIVKEMKQKDKISYDNDGFPTMAGIKWDNQVINLFFKDKIAKLPKVKNKGNAFYPYTQLEETTQKQLISSMEYITYIYVYAYDKYFKNDATYTQFINNAKKSLKVQKWKEKLQDSSRVTNDTKIAYVMDYYSTTREQATLMFYGNPEKYNPFDETVQKWKYKKQLNETVSNLRKNSDIKTYLTSNYTTSNQTSAKNIATSSTSKNDEINECIEAAEKIKKKTDTDTDREKAYVLCQRKPFERLDVKSACVRYFKGFSVKEKKVLVKENLFCKSFF